MTNIRFAVNLSPVAQGLAAAGVALLLLSGCGNDDAVDASTASMEKMAEKVTDTVSDTAKKVSESVSEGAKQVAQSTTEVAQNAAGNAANTVTTAVTDTAQTEADSKTQAEAPKSQPETVATATPAPVDEVIEPKASPVKRTGAHGAAVDFFTALHKGDAKAALAVVDGTDTEKQALTARADYQRASLTFKKAFVKAYGDGAWGKFNDPDYLPEPANTKRPPFNARLSVFEQNDLDQMVMYKPQENGDEAVYPAEQGELKVVKKDGQWKLVAATMLPPGLDGAEKASQILTASTSHIIRLTQAVGKAGISADDIDTELGRAIVETLYGFTSQEPHRFDVGSLK